MTVVKKCTKCNKIGIYNENTNIHKGNNCNGNVVKCNISCDDLITISRIANDNAFIQAMIDLKEKNIIEYNLKMSQFRTQVQQQESMKQQLYEQQNSNQLKCPTCGSTNVKKISATSKIGGAMTFGLLSKTARSQFKCEKCGYKW